MSLEGQASVLVDGTQVVTDVGLDTLDRCSPPPPPISQLPAEILEEIFAICMARFFGFTTPVHPLSWTQVCQEWRRIALHSPRLWSRIDLCRPASAQAFLQRSSTASLAVVSHGTVKGHADYLVPHAERIHSMDICLFPDDMAKLFASINLKIAPRLTSLTLQLVPLSAPLVLDIDLSSVRHLNLSGISVLRWETCRQLSFLSIRGLGQDLSPPLSSLLTIFSKSPHLEHVRLEGINPPDVNDEQPRPQAGLMACLRMLVISGSPLFISSILHGITFPPSTRVQLYTSLSEDLHHLFPGGRFPFDKPPGETPSVSSVRLARHAAYFIRNSTSYPWKTDLNNTGFSISSSTCTSMHVLNSIPYLLDPLLLTSIELSTGVLTDIPSFALQWLLSRTKNLHTIRLAFNDLSTILDLLSPRDVNKPILCPKLQSLTFNKPGDFWWNFAEQWVELIIICARSRHHSGVPLRSLDFHRCHGMTAEVQERFGPFMASAGVSSRN
ncbi:hypothetical protein BKA70DRAFT_44836 [Coprinopsis sp. MPI-PUGE-AT-0042]|nr:hypothetical protein BKA70DRAFT_44836 [Coprinopsis sp. MPI-PUGE-AT-0042]